MNRLIIFVALLTASFLAAYAEGVVDAPWSFAGDASQSAGPASKAEVAAKAASDEVEARRAIWRWAALH